MKHGIGELLPNKVEMGKLEGKMCFRAILQHEESIADARIML